MNILIAGNTSDYVFLSKKLKHFLKSVKKPTLLYRSTSPMREFLVKYTFSETISSMIYQEDESDAEMLQSARAFLLFKDGKRDMNLLKLAQKAKLQIRIIEK